MKQDDRLKKKAVDPLDDCTRQHLCKWQRGSTYKCQVTNCDFQYGRSMVRPFLEHYNEQIRDDPRNQLMSEHKEKYDRYTAALKKLQLQQQQLKAAMKGQEESFSVISTTKEPTLIQEACIYCIEKAAPFNWMETQCKSLLSYKYSAKQIANYIKEWSAQLFKTQFNQYDREYPYGVLMFDGWTSAKGEYLVAILVQVEQQVFLCDLVTATKTQSSFWLAEELLNQIKKLKQHNITVIGLSCDNCPTNIAAYKLLIGDPNVLINQLTAQEREKVKYTGPLILLRCMAHLLDLILQKYCQSEKTKERIEELCRDCNIQSRIVKTRWLSICQAYERVQNQMQLDEDDLIDYKIIKLFTVAILQTEGDNVTCAQFKSILETLISNLSNLKKASNNENEVTKCKLALKFINDRDEMFESTLEIGDLYNMLDPNVANDESVIRFKMIKVFKMLGLSQFSVDDIMQTLKHFKRQIELRQTKLKTIYASCPDATKFLMMYESCSVSEAKCERLFSFFQRQTSDKRTQLNVETLQNMGCIYILKILPVIQEKMKNKEQYLNKCIQNRLKGQEQMISPDLTQVAQLLPRMEVVFENQNAETSETSQE